ncbi:cysteine desulfurase [Candidatus Bathyarchaeota archaeon]|nr:cysteine desulfurase [Candidatus Bathyarchaeota archaeon]
MLDIKKIREDFPILRSGLVYLDNAASSLTPQSVLRKMMEFYNEYRANVERGVHRLSQRASQEFEEAHRKVASFIHAKSEAEVVMTRNATEGINLVAYGIGWRKGDRILTTLLEHHSNFIVWLRLKRRLGVEVDLIRPSKEGILDPRAFEDAITDKTRLVAVTHVSNVLGTVTPIHEIAEIAHRYGALLLVDGAQSVPHMPIDVQRLECDFLAFSGHKMLGPTGIGCLYIREELLEEIEPLCIGGGTIEEVTSEGYKLALSPRRFEAGTPAIAEAIGLGAAVDYLQGIGMEALAEHERHIVEIIHRGLSSIKRVRVFGPEDWKLRTSIVSFCIGDLNPHDIALALDVSANIMVRSGFHCAMPLHTEVLNERHGTVRASTYLYNTKEEAEALISMVEEIARGLM